MAARSQTQRRFRAAPARLAGVALLAASFLGCQSNSDRDLIARDRRMQEDQIYALQDYINQYQQLLCRYRTENASLRRQLAQGTVTESPSSLQPLTQPRTNRSSNSRSATPPTQQFQTPMPPGAKEHESSPPQPPSDSQSPEVPPLNSSGFATPANDAYANADDSRESTGHVVAASYDEPLSGAAASAAGDQRHNRTNRPTHEKSDPSAGSTTVLLSGEVVANTSGGPRIMVDVVPPTSANDEQPFDGSASLMLLSTDANGEQHNVGRWDFNAEEVHAAVLDGAARSTLRFFVELPAGGNFDGPTQLWTRLVPRQGTKLLAHANINLTQPGIFSTRTESERTRLADELILAANCVEAPAITAHRSNAAAAFDAEAASERATSNDVSPTINEADWSIAQPGKPVNLPPETADKTGAGGWRVSAEPMPIASAHGTPPSSPSPTASMVSQSESKSPLLEMLPSSDSPSSVEPLAEKPVRRPNWAPGRDDEGAARHVAVRPNWSAKR